MEKLTSPSTPTMPSTSTCRRGAASPFKDHGSLPLEHSIGAALVTSTATEKLTSPSTPIVPSTATCRRGAASPSRGHGSLPLGHSTRAGLQTTTGTEVGLHLHVHLRREWAADSPLSPKTCSCSLKL